MVRINHRPSFLLTFILMFFFSGATNEISEDILLGEIDIEAMRGLREIMEDIVSEKENAHSEFYTVYLSQSRAAIIVNVKEAINHRL